MEKMIKVVNTQTGEEFERAFTPEELEAWEANENALAQIKAEAEAKEAARAELLARLGITADEAKLLLGGN